MAPVVVEVDTVVAVLDEAEPPETEITERPLVAGMGVEDTAVAEDTVVTAAADTVVAGDTAAVDMAEEDPITLPNTAAVEEEEEEEEEEEAVSLLPAGGRIDLSFLGSTTRRRGNLASIPIAVHASPFCLSGFPVLMI